FAAVKLGVFLYKIAVYKSVFKYKISFSALHILFELLRRSIPFALFAIFERIYYQIDVLMLSLLSSENSIGLYQASMRLVMGMMIIPFVFSSALYPVFSRFGKADHDKLKMYAAKALDILLIFSLPLLIIFFVFAEEILVLVFGPKAIPSVRVFQILSFSIPFKFYSFIFGMTLTALDRQSKRVLTVGICALLNVVLNLILIPQFDFLGAGIATLISELTIFSLYQRDLRFIIKPGANVYRIAASSLSLVIISYLLSDSLFTAVIVGIIFYTFVLILLRVVNREDYNFLRGIFAK
ncbi:MAG: polysaccharide biosynthesis C-terminal domain-containing protein, partial [Fidelibacterota bacterium]